MKRLIALLLFAVLIAASGCGEPQTGTAQTPDQKVALAATVAKEIQANPEQSVDILKKHNLTQEQFESLLYEIAADAELSRKYQTALTRK